MGRLPEILRSPWLAYACVGLLQLKVVWRIWRFRDLTSGDTSSYFVGAHAWSTKLENTFHWSPLYTSFYGSFLWLSKDAYWVTIAHRLVIVLLVSVLVLALMRRLLPGWAALLIAAWWAILPINFNALYEVHPFALIPVLAAFVLLSRPESGYRRGIGLAILGASVFLVRNELMIAVGLMGTYALIAEWRAWRRGSGATMPLLRRYGVPFGIAAAIVLFYYATSAVQGAALMSGFRAKAATSTCMVYAYGYMQRYRDWNGDPWSECSQLMVRTFGVPNPGMVDALLRNPAAMWEHYRWNLGLLPSGLQVSLFYGTSGAINPSFEAVRLERTYPDILTALTLLLVALTVAVARAHRACCWKEWVRDRIWGWVALLSGATVSLFAVMTQRPRPSYMFLLTLFLMAGLGWCATVLAHHFRASAYLTVVVPVVIAAAIVAVPSYYTRPEYPDAALHGVRPLRALYRRLVPFREVLVRNRQVFVLPNYYGDDLCAYVAGQHCGASMTFDQLLAEAQRSAETLAQRLDHTGVTLLYLDERVIRDRTEELDPFMSQHESLGWRLVASGESPGDRWRLLARERSAPGG